MVESHRLFNCARCRRLVRICTCCDRGNIYCPECAKIARHEHVREARRRYQQTERGRLNHKVQQQLYLRRQEKMMDQGPSIVLLELPPRARPAAKVLGQPAGREEVPDESESEVISTSEVDRCSCGGRLKLVALVTDSGEAQRYLSHVGLPSEAPAIAPARAPRQTELAFDLC
jgi:hypothetical protein